jgi:hypothetical protein
MLTVSHGRLKKPVSLLPGQPDTGNHLLCRSGWRG